MAPALLADGLHVASHAAALSIAAFAYVFARRNAHNRAYSVDLHLKLTQGWSEPLALDHRPRNY